MRELVLFKVQLVCLIITIFIAVLYFTSNRQNNKLHKSFGMLLVVLPIYLVFDIATVITVNNIETMSLWNDIFHRLFFISLIVVVFQFCNHMNYLIELEEGKSRHQQVVKIFNVVILIVAVVFSLTSKPDYTFSEITGYATANFAGGAFAAVFLYILIIVILLITHWKIIPDKKKKAISIALIVESIGLYFQVIHTDLLLSGAILTMMLLAFYLTLDNPDAVLLAQVQEEKEKADAANESKSAFLSVVSHEIRTPMNAVVGMTDLLLRDADSLTSKQEKYLRNIKNSGSALVMIVNDILDQSKIEAGKMEIVTDAYELRPMTEDVKMIIENRIGTKPIELSVNIDEEVPQFLVGDSLRIRQILINLMNNAVKFTEEGFIRLVIHKLEDEQERIKLRFSIEDSGQGIKSEDLVKLGEAFAQVDTQKNHGKEGTGLGISISKNFINLMGGQLEVASEYGKGSEFFFEIWQGISDKAYDGENDIITRQAWKDDENFEAEDAVVLVVDDTRINLLITEELLQPLKLSVDTADSGELAIELVSRKRYDAVFMDYMMPYMDGIETTRRIRKLETSSFDEEEAAKDYYEKLPIIALSGDTSDATMELFNQVGVNDFIEKPVELKSLKKQLLKWLPDEKITRIK